MCVCVVCVCVCVCLYDTCMWREGVCVILRPFPEESLWTQTDTGPSHTSYTGAGVWVCVPCVCEGVSQDVCMSLCQCVCVCSRMRVLRNRWYLVHIVLVTSCWLVLAIVWWREDNPLLRNFFFTCIKNDLHGDFDLEFHQCRWIFIILILCYSQYLHWQVAVDNVAVILETRVIVRSCYFRKQENVKIWTDIFQQKLNVTLKKTIYRLID